MLLPCIMIVFLRMSGHQVRRLQEGRFSWHREQTRAQRPRPFKIRGRSSRSHGGGPDVPQTAVWIASGIFELYRVQARSSSPDGRALEESIDLVSRRHLHLNQLLTSKLNALSLYTVCTIKTVC